jgi:hypothetical protein
MKLMTALVDVAACQYYDAEINKTRYKRATDQRKAKAKSRELEENIDAIKYMLTSMFKSVFVHR